MSQPLSTTEWPGEGPWWVGVILVVALGGCIAYILLRYPDFRRAFFDYWQPENIAKRLNEWAERNKR